MPHSLTTLSALERIAELAASPATAAERLRRILGAARDALGIDALSVVAAGLRHEESTVWQSAAEGFAFDSSLAIASARDAFAGTPPGPSDGDPFVITLAPTNGYRVALVGFGGTPDTPHSPLLTVLASYVSVLLENERLARALESSDEQAARRIEEIAAIYEIGQAVDAADAQPILDVIVAKATAVMGAQACSLMLRDPIDGALTIRASWGLGDDVVKDARIEFGDAVAGRVAQTGEPMLITDLASDQRFAGVSPRSGITGSMCVPLRDEDGVVHGVLSIRRHEPDPPFGPDDLKLFSVFATHAALAVSNAQLYSRLHRKVHEMSTISDVLRAINSTLDLDQVLDQIVKSITRVVGFDRCCVYLLDARTSEFVAGARAGYQSTDNLRDRVPSGEGVVGMAAREHIPIFSKGSPVESEGAERSGEFLVAPITIRDECIGVVVVDNCIRNRPIEPQHVELLATFVSQAGIAVENARLYEAMEEKYAELNVLYEHGRSISAAYGLDNAANMLVSNASRAIKCEGAGLLLLDTRRGHLTLQAAAGGMVGLSDRIEEIADDAASVGFVRDLRSPALLPSDTSSADPSSGPSLLDALAPRGSHLLLAPLVAEDTTIGVLALSRGAGDDFQGGELKLASIITSHAATVLKNAISYEQRMRQRVLELTALYEFSKEISSAANLEQALDSILAIAADLVDFDESFIYTVDHDREVATVKAARFRGKAQPLPPEEPLEGGSVTSWTMKERKALVSPDITRDPRFGELASGRRVRSLMSIPLIVHDQVVGVLSVHGYSPNQYSEEEVRTLSIVASQGAAIYNELEALSALTSYTDNILSSIAAGVVTLASDGSVLTWNGAAERIVGLKVSRVVERHYEDVLARLRIPDSEKEVLRRAVNSVLETGETYQGYKLCFHPRGHDDVYTNISISQLLNSAGEQLGLVLIFEDVTREIKMEDEFRRMGELAAVGQLAASIAHELRNPLSSIKGAAQFLQKEYEELPSVVEFLGIIVEEVNGLNRLTTEFLDFARPMQLEMKPTSVNRVVEKTLQLMSVHITDSNVVVHERLSPTVPEIQADEAQLEQVLKNIIINALQAMPDGGVLTVETGAAVGGGAYMSVSDTGIGIAPDKTDRIFQPFVTTKTKGTGLGLSVVHKIVENHGGRIEVVSEVGKGATFRVSLPRTGVHTTVTTEFDHTMERRVSGRRFGPQTH